MRYVKRLGDIKRVSILAVAVAMATAIAAPSASAAPAPGFEQFVGCPNVPAVTLCLRSVTNSGNIQIGNTNTPINKPIVLSGGVNFDTGQLTFNSQGG